MRDTPNPNCRAMEKPPPEFLEGGPVVAAGVVVPAGALVSADADDAGAGRAANASAMVFNPGVDALGNRRPQSLVSGRDPRIAGAGVSVAAGVDARTQSMTT